MKSTLKFKCSVPQNKAQSPKCHTDLPCHTERSEVSTKSKRALNSMDFSLVSLTQNDKSGVDFFATPTPCNPLGRFVLTHSAQNDNASPFLQVDFSLRSK